MLLYEIKKNALSDQVKQNIIPLIVWPFLEIFQVYFNYQFMLGNKIHILFGMSQNSFITFIFSAYIAYTIFDKYLENAWRIGFEKYQGVISQFFLTPFSRIKWLLFRSIGVFFSSSWIYALIYCFFVVFNPFLGFHMKIDLIFYLFCAIFSSIIFGGLLTSIFLILRDGSSIFIAISKLQYILSGIQVPVVYLPSIFLPLTVIFPLSLLTNSLNLMIKDNRVNLLILLLEIVLLNIIVFILSVLVLALVERRLRKTGEYDLS